MCYVFEYFSEVIFDIGQIKGCAVKGYDEIVFFESFTKVCEVLIVNKGSIAFCI